MAVIYPLEVDIYNKSNYSAHVRFAKVSKRVSNLRFGTQDPGGFATCSFNVAMPLSVAVNWHSQQEIYFYKVVITAGALIAWEGRIEKLEPVDGGLYVECRGFWSSCKDRGESTASVAGASTQAQIKDILTDVCVDINSDQSNIGSAGGTAIVTFTSNYAQDMILQCSEAGNSTGAQWAFLIYESGIFSADRAATAFFQARASTTPTWYATFDNIAGGGALGLARDIYELANQISSSDNTTSYTSDSDSQTQYKRRDILKTVGTEEAKTILNRLKNMPTSSNLVLNGVYGITGLRNPLWRVRAGDVIRVVDLATPARQTVVGLDQLSNFYIQATDYDADRDMLTLSLDNKSSDIISMLQAAGVR